MIGLPMALLSEKTVTKYCLVTVGRVPPGGLDAAGRLQVKLRQSEGGLGLASQADVAEAAYLASVVEAAPLLAAIHPSFAPLFTVTPAGLDSVGAAPAADAGGAQGQAGDQLYGPLRQALLSASPEQRAVLRESQESPPAAGTKRCLQRLLSVPVHAELRRAFEAAIAGDLPRMAAHRSQCGWLGTAWLRAPCNIRAGTRLDSQTFTRALHLTLGLGVLEAPHMPCPGRPDGLLLTPANAFSSFLGGSVANKNRFHYEVGCGVKTIAESMPGQVQVQTEVPDTPHTCQHERGVAPSSANSAPAGGFVMDFVVQGVASIGCTLNIDVTVSNPASQTYAARASKTSNYTAGKAHAAKVAKMQKFMPPTQLLLPMAFEAFGGCTTELADGRGVLETMKKWALDKARAVTGLREETSTVAKRRVLQRRDLILRGWQAALSVALARGRARIVADLLAACGRALQGPRLRRLLAGWWRRWRLTG